MEIKKQHVKYVLLIVLLVFGFFKTYSLHFNYQFPYHQDEWQHIAISKQAIEEGYNKQYNPYLDEPADHPDLEPGFHLFLSSAIILTELDPILYYQYLPAIFAVLSMLAIFYCIYRLTDNFYAGLLSAAVFLSLKSNVNILGKDFFVPLTMAFPFIFIYVLYFVDSLRNWNKKKLLFSLSILLIILLIHPPSFVILLIPSFIEFIINRKNIKISEKNSFIIFLIGAILTLIGISILWKGSILRTINFLFDLLYFEPGWGKLEISFIISLLFGLVNSFFAIIGFVRVVIGNKKEISFFVAMSFISLAITAMWNLFGFTYIIPYARAIHYSMLAMVPLTALGFLWFLDYLKKIIKINGLKKYVFPMLTVIFLYLIFSSSYSRDLQYKRYTSRVIDEQAYETLIWMKDNIPKNEVFVTPYFMTSSVYPISGHRTMTLIPAQLEGDNLEENLNFFAYSCAKQEDIIRRENVTYVFSRGELKCNFLEKIYDEKDIIYKVIN